MKIYKISHSYAVKLFYSKLPFFYSFLGAEYKTRYIDTTPPVVYGALRLKIFYYCTEQELTTIHKIFYSPVIVIEAS